MTGSLLSAISRQWLIKRVCSGRGLIPTLCLLQSLLKCSNRNYHPCSYRNLAFPGKRHEMMNVRYALRFLLESFKKSSCDYAMFVCTCMCTCIAGRYSERPEEGARPHSDGCEPPGPGDGKPAWPLSEQPHSWPQSRSSSSCLYSLFMALTCLHS